MAVDERLPEILLVHVDDFREFLKTRGFEGPQEPVAAAPLHDVTGVQLMVGQSVQVGTTLVRKGRKWFRITAPSTL